MAEFLVDEPIIQGYCFGNAQPGLPPSRANTGTRHYSDLYSITSQFRETHQIDDYEVEEAQRSLHDAHQAWIRVLGEDPGARVRAEGLLDTVEPLFVAMGITFSEEMFGEKLRIRIDSDGGELAMLAFMDWYVRHLYFAENDNEEGF